MQDNPAIPVNGVAPKRRIKDSNAAASICDQLDRDDTIAAMNRAKVLDLINGEAPFSRGWLNKTNQGQISNINFGGAMARLRSATTPYINALSAVESWATFHCDIADDQLRFDVEHKLAEEFDWAHRQWGSEFFSNYILLSRFAVRDGVAMSIHATDIDWRWRVVQLGDLKMPRNIRLGEGNIPFFKVADTMTVNDLWAKVEGDEHPGWNREVVQNIIKNSSSNQGVAYAEKYSWDKIAEMMKENDLWFGYSPNFRPLVMTKLLVKEFDQSWSLYIFDQNNPALGFAYVRHNFQDCTEDFMTIVVSDVGSGTYHSIRGLGYAMYPAEKALNIAKNKALDSGKLAGTFIVQPKDSNTLERLMGGIALGPITVFPADCQFPSVQQPNASTQLMPIIGQLERDAQNNTGTYTSRAITPDAQSRTATEAELQVQQEGILSSAQMDMWYPAMGRIFHRSYRRLINKDYRATDPGGDIALEFVKRLMKRGVSRELMETVDWVDCTRAIGNGSEQQQWIASQQLLSLSSQYDNYGRQAALYHATASIKGIGFQTAKLFVDPYQKRIDGTQVHMAGFENDAFQQGIEKPVLTTDDHYLHANLHLEFMERLRDAAANGEAAMAQVIPPLNLAAVHTEGHYAELATNQSRQSEAKQIKQRLNMLANFIQTNTEKLRREQEQAEQQAMLDQQMQGPQLSPEAQQKLMENEAFHQQEIAFLQEKRNLQLMGEEDKLLTKRRSAELENAIKDTNNAAAISRENLASLNTLPNGR